jgi:hypothetical protein
MMKIQIDDKVTTATDAQSAEILEAQSSAVDFDAIAAQERANRKIAYDKFIELGLTPEVALTISGWVENPTPPSDAQPGGN